MKVKVKKHKKSPAPSAIEQAKIKSTIEMLRKTRAYGVPIHMVYDRGYRQFIDLADKIRETKEKTSAPFMKEQARCRTNAEIIHKCKSGFLAEFYNDVNPIRPKSLSKTIGCTSVKNDTVADSNLTSVSISYVDDTDSLRVRHALCRVRSYKEIIRHLR